MSGEDSSNGPGAGQSGLGNSVLRAMGPADWQALEAHVEALTLAAGDVLAEPGQPIRHVYFPLTAVASVVTLMSDGREVESDTVGLESGVGLLSALGDSVAVSRAFIQIPGRAARIRAPILRRQAEASQSLRRIMIRHAQANLSQAHQSVACNALHSLNERLCRWLLMSQDRTGGDVVRLTHEFLATMLGVQRSTVSEALRAMADAGLVRQRRGAIEILDRPQLEAAVCECYAAVKANLALLIGPEFADDDAAG